MHYHPPFLSTATVPIMGPVGRNGDLYGVVVEDPYLGRTPGPGVRVLPLAADLGGTETGKKTSPKSPETFMILARFRGVCYLTRRLSSGAG